MGRPWRKLRVLVLAGPPSPFIPARVRQRLNLRFQERRNLKRWVPVKYKEPSVSPALFIHVPKNAGTSLSSALKTFAGFEELGPRIQPRGNRLISVHYDPNWLAEHQILSEAFLSEAFSFAFVRNPIDRALSTYRYYKRQKTIPETWTFSRYLEYVNREKPKIGGAHVARMSHAAKQSDWLVGSWQKGPSKIFKLEELGAAALEIGAVLGVELSVPQLNSTVPEHVVLTPKDNELLRALYHEDFVNFNYQMPI